MAVDIAVSHFTTPFISVYPWLPGFGVKYSNPATLPTGSANKCAFTANASALAVGHSITPFLSVYPWTEGVGFGIKFTNPAVLSPDTSIGINFAPDGGDIAVGHPTTPFVSAWQWSGAGFGTKYASPSGPRLPDGSGAGVSFSHDSQQLALAHSTTQFQTVYDWATPGFGTKFADPATLPTGNASDAVFHTSNNDLVISHLNSPYVSAYPWNPGYGVKYSNPATLPESGGQGMGFSADGNDLAIASFSVPSGKSLYVYDWNTGSGFGTKYSDPASGLPALSGFDAAFSFGDIALAHNGSPRVSAWPWTVGVGFGTKYADPATLPTGDGKGVAFSNQAEPPVSITGGRSRSSLAGLPLPVLL